MCGIFGIVSDKKINSDLLLKMNNLLKHRGPDDEGYLFLNIYNKKFRECSGEDTIEIIKNKYTHIRNVSLADYNLFFGHRRLSIIDLSENGHQPMCDSSEKIWITYNGEIYNYIELRDELVKSGYKFKSKTDTEVILNSYLKWGTDCVNHFNGMWAFAIWDSYKNFLFLSRDRFGVKPIYYTYSSEHFAFSSEIKPLICFLNYNVTIKEKELINFILYANNKPVNGTFLNEIYEIPASNNLFYQNKSISIEKYYNIPINNNSFHDNSEKELTTILTDSVKLRFRSDVPVGTCLSGGFDSTSIVSLANIQLNGNLKTFSAVWSDSKSDESKYIDIVNNKFQTEYHKVEPQVSDFINDFERIHYYQELPTIGPGLIPQWHVMNLSKDFVKVLLNGQGGDELFGGYFKSNDYLLALLKAKKYLEFFRNFDISKNILKTDGLKTYLSYIFPKSYYYLHKNFSKNNFANILDSDFKYYYESNNNVEKKFGDYLKNKSYDFIVNKTIPSLLHYEDRASMAHSIESRTPFLDYRLVEFAFNLDWKSLIEKETSRPFYRNALKPYIPIEVFERKDKLGYPTPFSTWIATDLNEYVNDTLTNKNLLSVKYFNISAIMKLLDKHIKNSLDISWLIWRILSFEYWIKLIRNCE